MSRRSGAKWREWRAMQRTTTAHIWQMLDDTGVKRELLAQYLGCNPSYLADLRKAHVPMSAPMQKKLGSLLGIDEQELFGEYLRESAVMKGRE